ncbi:membrane-associating domain-containing protein [Chaetomidium leptoderma]|uniref:Membrane-associating domain-containing protein n=1 Tax=Chaetomidium leptoderma TaxID=669021 RepID=A0AAN6VRX5_9PEZI|nr:membrane-associating domain-containing protein [Chaetomidium leptoderma]
MSFPLMLVIRVIQAVCALVVLALSGSVAKWYNTATAFSSPPQINFLLFGAIWSFFSLSCIEVLPRFLTRSKSTYIAAPFDLTNTLFSFAGFVALAVFLQGLLFCRGAVCHAARADVAFGAFSFALWTASAVMTALEIVRAKRTGGGLPAGTGAVPAMKKKEAV